MATTWMIKMVAINFPELDESVSAFPVSGKISCLANNAAEYITVSTPIPKKKNAIKKRFNVFCCFNSFHTFLNSEYPLVKKLLLLDTGLGKVFGNTANVN